MAVVTTIRDLVAFKQRGERFSMITAYDFPSMRLVAATPIPVVLVGDSLGNNVLGYETTLPVTMDEMLHHARAVARGATDQLLVGDLPFNAYHASDSQAINNAGRFLKNGMHAVKLEGGGKAIPIAACIAQCGIPVMGHLGLTPQWVNAFGGFKVQGKTEDAAERIIEDAHRLEEAGAFSIVLEGVPRELAAAITQQLSIPTIGIGAGPDCDGQVLVWHDLLGINRGPLPKFAKPYGQIGDATIDALRRFAADVAAGAFPDDEHSYHADLTGLNATPHAARDSQALQRKL